MRFAEGLLVSPESGTNMGWGSDLISCSIDFIDKLKEIAMDHMEFCILNGIVLTFPGQSTDDVIVLFLETSRFNACVS